MKLPVKPKIHGQDNMDGYQIVCEFLGFKRKPSIEVIEQSVISIISNVLRKPVNKIDPNTSLKRLGANTRQAEQILAKATFTYKVYAGWSIMEAWHSTPHKIASYIASKV